MNRIYVASSWRNKIQQDVVAALREVGHEVYDFKNPSPDNHGFHWSEVDPEWKVWTPERYRNLLDHPVAKKGFKSDWEAMLWADTCVLVLPSGRSAHIEAGYFVGAHKRLVILLDAEGFEPELMYKMAGRICCSIPEVTETLNLKQMNEPNPTTTAMADAAIWIERAEKAEAELSKAAALINAARDESAISSVTCGQMRKELEHAQLERDHYKNKVERYREVLGANTNESICEAAERVKAQYAALRAAVTSRINGMIFAEYLFQQFPAAIGHIPLREYMDRISDALSSTAGTSYVHADDMTPALEGALVICQCFADGQEASPGFMDNNENVLRIKDALAKAKRFLA